MEREFVYLSIFDLKSKKKQVFNNQFQRELEYFILGHLKHPSIAPVIRGTNGIRKIRFAPSFEKRGKSGSYRIFFVDFPKTGKTILLALLDKHESENLTKEERNILAEQVKILRNYYN